MPGGIAEIKYLRVGGVDQWVMIRGENVSNPPLILLHGGPGMSETSFFRHCNAPLEKSFTVVYWDQRGAGKSFDRDIPPSPRGRSSGFHPIRRTRLDKGNDVSQAGRVKWLNEVKRLGGRGL